MKLKVKLECEGKGKNIFWMQAQVRTQSEFVFVSIQSEDVFISTCQPMEKSKCRRGGATAFLFITQPYYAGLSSNVVYRKFVKMSVTFWNHAYANTAITVGHCV